MSLNNWFLFILVIQIIHGLGTWKLYIKAGRKAWEAFVPLYNAFVLMKIISRPWWWIILLFLPIVNLIMFPAVWVETARSFGKNSLTDTILAIVTLGFYNYYLNYVADVNYIENRDLKPTSAAGDWISSILFAVVAATIVHTYFIQPFVIPTSSLEKSLLVGDFLLVSKMHYGARVPMTTIAAPMVHDTLPVVKVKSYIPKFELPYLRFPAFQKIKNNDIVVFNWPTDTMLDMRHTDKYYYKPIDKKTNYVKRCVAIAGDTLEIKDGYVWINGQQNQLPDRAYIQFSYSLEFKRPLAPADIYRILQKFDITDGLGFDQENQVYIIPAATEANIAKLKNHPDVASVNIRKSTEGRRIQDIFPSDPSFDWNNDFFGPLYIPKQGSTIELTVDNLPLYKHAITHYENHKVSVNGNQVLIDGNPTSNYTFEKDYYWMMGDNRHNSQDSRVWGLVPHDHIIGKPVFKWMSIKGINDGLKNWSIRGERVFTTVSGEGEPRSYFIPFVVVLGLIYGFSIWRKKKQQAK